MSDDSKKYNDDIGKYYDRCREQANAAWERYQEARKNGVTGKALQRLYDAWLAAANTGD